MIIWFKRNDGQLFAATEDSAHFTLMKNSGEFDEVLENIETPDGEKIALTGKPELWKDNESDAQTNKSALADAAKESDSGQGSPAKRGRTRKADKG